MRPLLVGAVGILVAGSVWPRAVEASDTNESRRASIVVRTYTQPAWEGAVPAARATASAILGRTGVDVAWIECGLPAQAGEAAGTCTQPLGSNELVLRILPAGTVAHQRDLHALGFAFVDLAAGGGSLATVYADRVGRMAQSAGIDAAELLGRAMAHEIGHLLLGTNRHASQGLMRASWSSTDLRRSPADQWLFRGKEGDVMRQAIARRRRASAVLQRLASDGSADLEAATRTSGALAAFSGRRADDLFHEGFDPEADRPVLAGESGDGAPGAADN